jgi:hypothetical protein
MNISELKSVNFCNISKEEMSKIFTEIKNLDHDSKIEYLKFVILDEDDKYFGDKSLNKNFKKLIKGFRSEIREIQDNIEKEDEKLYDQF